MYGMLKYLERYLAPERILAEQSKSPNIVALQAHAPTDQTSILEHRNLTDRA